MASEIWIVGEVESLGSGMGIGRTRAGLWVDRFIYHRARLRRYA